MVEGSGGGEIAVDVVGRNENEIEKRKESRHRVILHVAKCLIFNKDKKERKKERVHVWYCAIGT